MFLVRRHSSVINSRFSLTQPAFRPRACRRLLANSAAKSRCRCPHFEGGGRLMRESTPVYLARCHCGALTARYQTDLAPTRWSVRADQCSFCRAHGAAMTSDPAGALEFAATDPTRLSRYRFGTQTADFLLCGHCGIFIGGTMTHQGRRFGVL